MDVAFATGYIHFITPQGVDGLVKVRAPRLDILFIGTSHPGSGQFRHFIKQAKTEFDTICIWEIWSDLLMIILPRYGFEPTTDVQDGVHLTGFRWDKPSQVPLVP
jgi:hypothetical protein